VAPRALALRPKTWGNFLKPRQVGFHFFQAPDRFHQQGAHAPVAHPINTAQLLIGTGTELTWTTTDVTASAPANRRPARKFLHENFNIEIQAPLAFVGGR
jgi:hypothetical protein